ncbi:MAG: RIP metalloprotease RseP [Pseudomonadota bacterium]|nr:RIP metalloprotease RseP [Pseudomonadota bacterium]
MDFSWLIYPVSFLVILGIVVTIHELGHFLVARYFGIKVIRFSVGFGKPFYSRYDKHGTEFCVCSIPLGGYVRLLDSRQDDVAEHEVDQDFTQKSPWARLAVYAAGPAINIVFAVFVFAAYAMLGVTQLPAVVGLVEKNSIAEAAGLQPSDEIIAIAGKPVTSWETVSFQFIEEAGYTGQMPIDIKRQVESVSQVKTLKLNVENFMRASVESPLESLGITPKVYLRPAIIGQVRADDPADQAGWQANDKVLSLNDQPVEYWTDLYRYVRDNPAQDIKFVLERDGQLVEGFVTPKTLEIPEQVNGEPQVRKVGQIGVGPQSIEDDPTLVRQVEYSLPQAMLYGLEQTWERTRLVVISIGKLITGALALDNVTGPVTIAEIAGKTAQVGISSSLNFLAYLSISLGVFNLLPVPMLDGGHIAFIIAELVRGKPVSMHWQQKYMMVGVALLGSLMMLALFNDVTRLFS